LPGIAAAITRGSACAFRILTGRWATDRGVSRTAAIVGTTDRKIRRTGCNPSGSLPALFLSFLRLLLLGFDIDKQTARTRCQKHRGREHAGSDPQHTAPRQRICQAARRHVKLACIHSFPPGVSVAKRA
jgi:hypothetical protein